MPSGDVAPELRSFQLTPIAPAEREEFLDILRGFALFGVLLVNIEYFVSPSYPDMIALHGPYDLIDNAALRSVRFLAESKFYTLFSFLFGYGMALQMARLEARGAPFVSVWARRQSILFIIGAFHAVLFWVGDILTTYAVLGLVLLLFRKRSARTLVITGCCLAFVSTLMIVVVCAMIELASFTPEGAAEMQADLAHLAAEGVAAASQALHIYAHGPFADIMARRIVDLKDTAWMILFMAPSVMGMFLFGFLAGRRKLLHDPQAHPTARRMVLTVGLPLGLIGNAIHVVWSEQVDWAVPSWSWVQVMVGIAVAGPALSACYVVGLAHLSQRSRGRRWLAPLAAVGRTALSNYLLQSLICTTICCSYGLGLYGRVGPLAGVGLTAILFAAQVWLSNWWLRRFRFGPAEWLWRSCTYGRRQPMRAQSNPQPA